MIELIVDGVGKRYSCGRWALRDVSLRLGGGTLGLIGPNGAGKTTLLRILATLLTPTAGRVSWDGREIARDQRPLRSILGYVPQDFGVYPQLTAREFLRYIGELKGLSGSLLSRRVETALETVRLRVDADRRLRGFSGGMIRRVGIAQALLNEPRVLVLDEPTVGLDPAERVRFRETLSAVSGKRLTILSTHIIADVEATATELAILQAGRLLWYGTPACLLADAAGSAWSLAIDAATFELVRERCQISMAIRHGDGVEARLVAASRPHPLAMPVAPSLEEAYLFVTGGERDSVGHVDGILVSV